MALLSRRYAFASFFFFAALSFFGLGSRDFSRAAGAFPRRRAAAARARTAQPQRRPDRRKPVAARRAPRPAPALPAVPSPPPASPPPGAPPPPADASVELDAALGSYAEDPAFEDVPRLELGFGDDDDRSVRAFPSRGHGPRPVACALRAPQSGDEQTRAAGNPGRHVHVLDWHSKTDARTILGVHGARGFDTVIASDVLYDPKDLGPFFAARSRSCARAPRRRAAAAGRRGPRPAARRRARRRRARRRRRRARRRRRPPRARRLGARRPRLVLVYEDRLLGFEDLLLERARDAGLVAESVDFLGTFFDPDLDIVDGDAGTPAFFSENCVAPGSGSWTSLRLFVFTPLRH
ncbi:hypothetical protein SO694_00009477 [Aureococcus anophagefferens]|uniref:Uncharacterized protein n=1 Tax=Aureococcus anophagefferens TaxID=44056 RepID=A0ABR1GEA3_AURAN